MISDEARSPLVRDARALLARVVEAIAESRAHKRHSLELLSQSLVRVQWSDALVGQSMAIRDRLRETVSALASLERTKGVPPERMLVLLKAILVEAKAEKLDASDAQSLLDDVIRWGIEAYYAA